jgi:hypothetical protein
MRRTVRRFAAAGASVALAFPLMSATFARGTQAVPADTVVAGRALAADGLPVGGMKVSLLAWPTSAVLQRLKVGQKVPQLVVGHRHHVSGR